MSNILSASSKISIVTRIKLVVPVSKKSINRPGVATKISYPLIKHLRYKYLSTPP